MSVALSRPRQRKLVSTGYQDQNEVIDSWRQEAVLLTALLRQLRRWDRSFDDRRIPTTFQNTVSENTHAPRQHYRFSKTDNVTCIRYMTGIIISVVQLRVWTEIHVVCWVSCGHCDIAKTMTMTLLDWRDRLNRNGCCPSYDRSGQSRHFSVISWTVTTSGMYGHAQTTGNLLDGGIYLISQRCDNETTGYMQAYNIQ